MGNQKKFRVVILAGVTLAMSIWVVAASAAVITFDSLQGPDGASFPDSVTEFGFKITRDNGLWFQQVVFGDPAPSLRAGESSSLPAAQTIVITEESGDTFRAFSWEAFCMSSSSDERCTGTITGHVDGEVEFEDDFSSTPGKWEIIGLAIPSGNLPIDALLITIDYGSPPVSIDNISLSLEGIPEPTTLALFGLGLAGLGGVRRRKRLAA